MQTQAAFIVQVDVTGAGVDVTRQQWEKLIVKALLSYHSEQLIAISQLLLVLSFKSPPNSKIVHRYNP